MTCNPSSFAASQIRQKYASGFETVFDGYHHALDDVCVRMPQDLQPKTRTGASSPTGTSSHKRPFTSFSPTISSTHDTCSEITTRPMTMTLPSRHPSRPATQGNLSAVTVLNLLQKCVVHFCSEFNIVTGASAPLRPATPPVLLLLLR